MRSGVIQGKFVHGGPKVSVMRPHLAARPAPHHPGFLSAAQPRTVQPSTPRGATPVDSAALRLPAGTGRPLPEAERRHMEAVFGARLADVRIHEGPQASAIGAVAFTLGSQIHFAPGHFVPGTGAGRQLLGHEIAHVLQQRAGRVRNPLGSGLVVLQDPALEAEAERMGLRAAQAIPQGPATSVLPSIGPGAVAGGRMDLQPARVAQLMKRKRPTQRYHGEGIVGSDEGSSDDDFKQYKDWDDDRPLKKKKMYDSSSDESSEDSNDSISEEEFNWIQSNKTTLPFAPPPPPQLPCYLVDPDWQPGDPVAGGTEVRVTLGPEAAASTNRGSTPLVGHCSCVENLNLTSGKRWVKGHLLNEQVGGPGTCKNLTALTHTANMTMRGFDSVLLRAVNACRWLATWNQDSYFYGVKLKVKVSPTKMWPHKTGDKHHVAQSIECKMEYVRQKKGQPHSPPQSVPFNFDQMLLPSHPSTTDLKQARRTYSCA